MIKYLKSVTISILIILAAACGDSLAAGISTADLIKESAAWDGQIVTVSGEVVGVPVKVDRGVWVNILEGKRAIGIFCARSAVELLQYFGDYNYTGDVIEVTGKFNAHCPEHRGELDIHAESIKVEKCGYKRAHRQDRRKVKLAVICLIAALVTRCVLFFNNNKR